MENQARPDFSIIIRDNEQAAAQALADGHFVQAYLLVHSLVEALLRLFLRIPEEKDVSFDRLIQKYRSHLKQERYPLPTSIDELTLHSSIADAIASSINCGGRVTHSPIVKRSPLHMEL